MILACARPLLWLQDEAEPETVYDVLCQALAIFPISPEASLQRRCPVSIKSCLSSACLTQPVSQAAGEMQLEEGDLIDVYDQTDVDWWYGYNHRSKQG